MSFVLCGFYILLALLTDCHLSLGGSIKISSQHFWMFSRNIELGTQFKDKTTHKKPYTTRLPKYISPSCTQSPYFTIPLNYSFMSFSLHHESCNFIPHPDNFDFFFLRNNNFEFLYTPIILFFI